MVGGKCKNVGLPPELLLRGSEYRSHQRGPITESMGLDRLCNPTLGRPGAGDRQVDVDAAITQDPHCLDCLEDSLVSSEPPDKDDPELPMFSVAFGAHFGFAWRHGVWDANQPGARRKGGVGRHFA